MTEYEKELLNQLVVKFKELQQINSKEELGKAINNIIIASIFKHRSDEFIDKLFIIKRDIFLNEKLNKGD